MSSRVEGVGFLVGMLIAALIASAVVLAYTEADDARAVEAPQPGRGTQVATFAGGCFWCMEPPFDALDGVVSTTSGYMGGQVPNPSYAEVSSGTTGHLEVVQIVYEPAKIDYDRLLEVYWRNIDPLDAGGQFCDRGPQYRSAIFVHDDAQRDAALAALHALNASRRFDRPIATEIIAAQPFYPAEAYHQDYYRKNPARYRYYRWRCGRDARLQELWGKP